LADISSSCFLLLLLAVKLLKMSAHCANAGTGMIYPCTDSGVNNVLL